MWCDAGLGLCVLRCSELCTSRVVRCGCLRAALCGPAGYLAATLHQACAVTVPPYPPSLPYLPPACHPLCGAARAGLLRLHVSVGTLLWHSV